MHERLCRIDDRLLTYGDRAVLYLWNEWSMPRHLVLRMLIVPKIVTEMAWAVSTHNRILPVFVGLMCGPIVLGHVMSERLMRTHLEVLSAFARTRRELRLVIAALAASFVVPPTSWLMVASELLMLAYLYAYAARVPRGPPHPRPRGHAFAGAPA